MKPFAIGEIADLNPRMPQVLTRRSRLEVSFIPMADIGEDGQLHGEQTRCVGELLKGYTYFPENAVIFAKIAPCMQNGKAAYIEKLKGGHGFGSTEFHVLRPKPGVDGRYLFYMVWNPRFRHYAERRFTGSAGQKRVPASAVAEFKIPLPPLAEQKRIAAILDQADRIRRRRQERASLYLALSRSYFNDLFGNINANDKDWPIINVAEAGFVQLGRQRSPKYQTGKHTCPYVRVANVFEDYLELSDVLSMDFDQSDFEKYKLEAGDILLNEGQSTELVGRPAMWDNEIPNCCFQNTLIRFTANRDIVEPEFALAVFLVYLRSGQFARVSSKTSSVAHLGAGRLSDMPFPLPPLKLQRQFRDFRISIRQLEKHNKQLLENANSLYNSIVQRAFRGDI